VDRFGFGDKIYFVDRVGFRDRICFVDTVGFRDRICFVDRVGFVGWKQMDRICRCFEPGGSLDRRVIWPRAPAQMGRRETEREGGKKPEGDGHERWNPAAFVFVPHPGRVRLQ
jgi:hypothetical protein